MTLWITQRKNTVLPFHMVSCSLPIIFCPPLRSSMLNEGHVYKLFCKNIFFKCPWEVEESKTRQKCRWCLAWHEPWRRETENSLDEVGVLSYMETAGFYFKGSSPKKVHRKNSQVGVMSAYKYNVLSISMVYTHTHTLCSKQKTWHSWKKNYNKYPGGDGTRL